MRFGSQIHTNDTTWDVALEVAKLMDANYPFIEQIRLMLGLLYSRYLAEPTKAKENLQIAMDGLTDAGQRQMCSEELENLNVDN